MCNRVWLLRESLMTSVALPVAIESIKDEDGLLSAVRLHRTLGHAMETAQSNGDCEWPTPIRGVWPTECYRSSLETLTAWQTPLRHPTRKPSKERLIEDVSCTAWNPCYSCTEQMASWTACYSTWMILWSLHPPLTRSNADLLEREAYKQMQRRCH